MHREGVFVPMHYKHRLCHTKSTAAALLLTARDDYACCGVYYGTHMPEPLMSKVAVKAAVVKCLY